MPMDEALLAQSQSSSHTTSYSPPGAGIGSVTEGDYHPLLKYYSINDPTQRDKDALSRIWEFAKGRSENKDNDSILWEVIKMSHKIGSSSIDEKSYVKLECYIKIFDRTKREAEEKINNLTDAKIEKSIDKLSKPKPKPKEEKKEIPKEEPKKPFVAEKLVRPPAEPESYTSPFIPDEYGGFYG
jgi:hypothetical protein